VRHHPGDTVFTDLDLSARNLPVGSRLQIGAAVLEISDVENDACAKFAAHYGTEVLQWIRLPQNRPLRLRGLFAKIVRGGQIHVGDLVAKLMG
jgi:MOSC domain-containing protein YiiM